MSYDFRPAKREGIHLLLGLSSGTGGGKTMSAMRLATGMSHGARFAVIDTENGRARHYADAFNFDVADLRAPFRPEAYADAIEAAAKQYPVVVVDSASHEWAGEGGILDWQEDELDRMAGTDYKKREACKMAAWIKPKMAHKAMVQRLLQVPAHVILCFRAEAKIEMVRDAHGKLEVREKQTLTGLHGWVPICEKNLPYELTASFLLMADKPGVPQPIKLQAQHRPFFPLDQAISEEAGARLAAWAKGSLSTSALGDAPASAAIASTQPSVPNGGGSGHHTAPANDWIARIQRTVTKAELKALGIDWGKIPKGERDTVRSAYTQQEGRLPS